MKLLVDLTLTRSTNDRCANIVLVMVSSRQGMAERKFLGEKKGSEYKKRRRREERVDEVFK